MKRVVLLACLLLLPLAAASADEEGDEKIRETIKDIEEAEKEQKRKPPRRIEEEEEDDGCLLGDILARIFSEIFWQYAASVRFADYPYAGNASYVYSVSALRFPGETKFVSAHGATQLACHFDGTFGNVNRAAVELAAFHLNFYNQNIFAATQSITVLSVNGGFSLIVRGFVLNGYLGIYRLDFLDSCRLSFGLSGRLFLPARLYLDLYNLNSVVGSARCVHLLSSLNWTVGRFAVGLGYDYSRLGDFTYHGPCLRLSFWL